MPHDPRPDHHVWVYLGAVAGLEVRIDAPRLLLQRPLRRANRAKTLARILRRDLQLHLDAVVDEQPILDLVGSPSTRTLADG